jgi:hypothetical protein
MAYVTLVASDIYRDGGSLEARFRCDDGSFESLWLQARPIDRSYQRFAHTELKVASSADGAKNGKSLLRGSTEEEAVLARLRSFMMSPKVDVPFSHRTPVDHHLEKVTALIDAIPNRKDEPRA